MNGLGTGVVFAERIVLHFVCVAMAASQGQLRWVRVVGARGLVGLF